MQTHTFNNLPVPVLAEPIGQTPAADSPFGEIEVQGKQDTRSSGGEARESNLILESREGSDDSRGGQNNLRHGEVFTWGFPSSCRFTLLSKQQAHGRGKLRGGGHAFTYES